MNNVWAVGNDTISTPSGPLDETLAEQWNGSSWSLVPTPSIATINDDLFGTAATSASDVWAVGQVWSGSGSSFSGAPLVEHYNGAAWTITPQPAPLPQSGLSAVAALSPSNAWAVGISQSAGRTVTLTEHWNGSNWTRVGSPNVGTGNNELLSVTALSANNVWAVGFSGSAPGAHYKTLVEHWNGSSWQVIGSPNFGAYDNLLEGISGSGAADVWAVGVWLNPQNGAYMTLTEHWGGGGWQIISSPNPGGPGGGEPGGDNDLFGVRDLAANNVWAVGTYAYGLPGPSSTPIFHALVEHWDGSAWTTICDTVQGNTTSTLSAVGGTGSDNVWTVGYANPPVNGNIVDQTLTINFVVPPTVTGMSPTSGGTPGGDTVTFTGTNLDIVRNVYFGSIPAASFAIQSATQMTAVTPAEPAGQVNVVLYYGADNSANLGASSYTYVQPTAPGAPLSVSALGGDASASVYWAPPASDGHEAITGYTVMASPGGTTASAPATAHSAVVPGLTNGTSYTFTVVANNGVGPSPPGGPSPAVVPGRGLYHPVGAARILDTRNGIGASTAPLGPGGEVTLLVTGAGGAVPPSNVAAVVLNVTVTDTLAGSYLTVYPTGLPRPVASSLNWTAGRTVANLVEVPLGADGKVTFFNAAGSADVIADVEGYVTTANVPSGPDGQYAPVAPSRVLDTRTGIGGVSQPIAGGYAIPVQVIQPGPEAVVLNVTATGGTKPSYLTIWADGAGQPVASNLNFAAGQTVANRVIVPVSSSGKIEIFNAAGSVNVVVDLNGSFSSVTGAGAGGSFQGMQPTRIVDTRAGGSLAPGGTLPVPVAGANGIPSSAIAVVATVTVTNPSAASYLTAWSDGTTRPTASDLNWVTGETVPNLVVVKLGANGSFDLYNALGTTDVIVDVVGWYAP